MSQNLQKFLDGVLLRKKQLNGILLLQLKRLKIGSSEFSMKMVVHLELLAKILGLHMK